MSCCNDNPLDQQGKMGQEMDLQRRSYVWEMVRESLPGATLISVVAQSLGGTLTSDYPTNSRGNLVYLVGHFVLSVRGVPEDQIGLIRVTNVTGVPLEFRTSQSDEQGAVGLFTFFGAVSNIEVVAGTCSWHFMGWQVLVAPATPNEPPVLPGAQGQFLLNGDEFTVDESLAAVPPTAVYDITAWQVTVALGTPAYIFSFVVPKLGGVDFNADYAVNDIGVGTVNVTPVSSGTNWEVQVELLSVSNPFEIDVVAQITPVNVLFEKQLLGEPVPTPFTSDEGLTDVLNCDIIADNVAEVTNYTIPARVSFTVPENPVPGPFFLDQYTISSTPGTSTGIISTDLVSGTWEVVLQLTTGVTGGTITVTAVDIT